ncbi:MAG: hypothetical protein Ct9H300mP28_28900 [Pseudomonadota bacterium]|nr:MAG: hypothetical protein Ct9H300mP28_28900 [Pseudomonadota bacterium]
MPKDENTLILGIGGVGMHLAQRLVHEGYPITVIESDSEISGTCLRVFGCPPDMW